MRFLGKYLLLFFVTVNLATWLRMCYSGIPRLSLGYWPELLAGSIRQLIGALLGNPLFELIYNGLGYLAGIMLFLVIQHFFKLTYRWSAVVLGIAIGGAIYFLFEGHRRMSMAPDEVHYLLFVYGIAGAVFGFLYHRWIAPLVVAT